jgi:hypothetical protein
MDAGPARGVRHRTLRLSENRCGRRSLRDQKYTKGHQDDTGLPRRLTSALFDDRQSQFLRFLSA